MFSKKSFSVVFLKKNLHLGAANLKQQKLSNSEKYAWQFIQDHLESIPALSIVALGQQANVSTATIIRTLRKRGFKGYSDFKHHLVEENQDSYTNLARADSDIRSAIMKNEHEVTNTIKMIKIADVEKAVQQIRRAQIIYIFARGFSELIAEELLVKLQLLKKNCQLSDDPNIIQTLATDIRPGNLVIIISLNGETPELVEAARRISQNRAPILLITTNSTSSIGKYASLILCGFKSETTYLPAYEVHSRLPLQVITRVLLDSYVIRTKK